MTTADTPGPTDLSTLVQLERPEFYTDDPFPLYSRLRQESPAHYYEPLDLWLLTRYEDIKHVGRNPLVFSSADGILLNDFRYGNITASFFPPDAENFALDGPPRHGVLRRAIRSPFSALNVAKLDEQIRSVVSGLLDGVPLGTEVDWLHDVAMAVPSVIIASLLGMPQSDRSLLDHWSTQMLRMGAAANHEELAEAAAGMAGMYEYFVAQLDDRRRNPGSDLLSALVVAEDNGELSNATVHMMIGGVMAAGNETTRNLLSGIAVVFDQHPAQYAALVADPGLARPATEELLRWITPVRGFGRTVAEETTVAGQRMTVGQRVFMLYPAANRDETVFPDAEVFDITRDPGRNPHLSFGFGEHSCIGSALARLETIMVLEEMVKRFPSIRVVRAEREPQLLGNAYRRVQVVLGDAAR